MSHNMHYVKLEECAERLKSLSSCDSTYVRLANGYSIVQGGNMQTITKTTRLPEAVASAADLRAADLGITFTDVVEMALRSFLELDGNPSFELLEWVRDDLVGRYPDHQGFPRDVTLEVFREIRGSTEAWKLYVAATHDEAGDLIAAARDSLHRRIGRATKLVLGARVVGRSLPLDPTTELITSHALLEPSA